LRFGKRNPFLEEHAADVAIIVKRVSKKNLRRAVVPRYRRAPFLISYWKENLLFYENYLTGKIVGASAETAEVLDFFDDWRTVVEMGRRWPQYTAQSLRSTVRQLAQQTLLERATGKHLQESELVRALRRWRTNPQPVSLEHEGCVFGRNQRRRNGMSKNR
jgi:hypothetical protein